MKRQVAAFMLLMLIASACASPAPAPVPQQPAAPQPTKAPLQPTAAAALPTALPSATQGLPELRPPVSGGLLNPPTLAPTEPGTRPNTATDRVWYPLTASVVPPARYDHAFAYVFEVYTLVMFGGRSNDVLGDTWFVGSEWFQAKLKSSPEPRFGAEAVYDGYRLRAIIFGGRSDSKFFNDVWGIDTAADSQWERMATTGNAPSPRAGASIGLGTNSNGDPYMNTLIVTHGYSDSGYFDDTFILNLSKNTWENVTPAIRPSKRIGQCGGFDSAKGKMMLFGGQDIKGNLLDDLWLFDPARREWTEIKPNGAKPSARSGAAMASDYNGKLWLFGGKTASGASNELWTFDTTANRWTLIATKNGPSARYGHKMACAYSGDDCVVFGGQDAKGKALNDLWRYMP
jgi:hypothetical protein